MIVRPMMEYDIARFVDLAEMMHQESDSKDLPFSAQKMFNLAWSTMGSPDLLGAMAVHDSGEIVGFLLARREAPFFTEECVASENAFFVHPEFRGSRAAYKLIQHFKKWAQFMGIKKCFISANSGRKNNSVARFYQRTGFFPQGYNFVMEVK